MTSELPAHLRAYQTVLYEALADRETSAVRDLSPLDQLSRLAEGALPLLTNEAGTRATLLALGAVGSWPTVDAAMAAAHDLFGTPETFAEAIYAGRWLASDPDTGLALVQSRRYLEDAVVPDTMPNLHTDRDAVLPPTTFGIIWNNALRAASAIASLQVWRSRFVVAYLPRHESYRRAMALLAEGIDDLTLQVAAIERLNSLPGLGIPVASGILDQFHELERLYACSMETASVTEALDRTPSCPECGFVLGAIAPTAEARRVRLAIERGLASQQRRLAQRVIARLLALPQSGEEERLARFIQVVQTSDLKGLALVLDDDLVEFLRQLLDPSQAEPGLIERLAVSFPEVTLANVDAAVSEMRQLLVADVANAGGTLRLRTAASP